MKYIDTEKLKAEIKRYKNKADERLKIKGRTFSEEHKDLALQNLCGNLLHFISSLQQELPEVDLENYISNKLRELGADLINHKPHSFNRGLNVGKTNAYQDILDRLNIRQEE